MRNDGEQGNGNRVEIVETGQTRAPSVPYAVIRPGEIAPPVHRAQEVAEDGDNYEAIAPAQDAQGTNDAPPSTSYSHLSTASGQDQGDDRSHYNALARPRMLRHLALLTHARRVFLCSAPMLKGKWCVWKCFYTSK